MVNGTNTRRTERGASLVEALVAMLVMAFGMMAVAGIQGRLRYSGDTAKQRAEATRFAASELEKLRGYVAVTRTPDLAAERLVFEEIDSETTTIDGASTQYTMQRTVSDMAQGGIEVALNVSWLDRGRDESDGAMSMEWRTGIAAIDPKLALLSAIPPDFGIALRRLQDRHPAIPSAAKKLDSDRSAFKPSASGTTALVFNNKTGMVQQICTVQAATPTALLDDNDLDTCPVTYTGGAYLLSGHVVYSLGATADAESPADPVLPISVAIILSSSVHATAPICYTDINAGLNATDYHCVIEPRQPSPNDKALYWSGRSNLTGLTLAAGGHRVCRYSDDYNGINGIENSEHPLDYNKVNTSLAKQNFLVVAFGASCPAGQKVDVANQVFRNSVTALHQPS